MKDRLQELLNKQNSTEYARKFGILMHAKLQNIIIDGDYEYGDINLISKIKEQPNLTIFFRKNAKTELPIAGYINGKFISRRIDRIIIDSDNKTIKILDYKTDLDKSIRKDTYKAQITEYKKLICDIYPDYKVFSYILWTNDFCLEKCD